jgi:hypothetical protein
MDTDHDRWFTGLVPLQLVFDVRTGAVGGVAGQTELEMVTDWPDEVVLPPVLVALTV